MFGVAKAEIIDSHGNTTGEMDAVIYDQGTASCLSVMGVRRIVKVESVAATVEVKSRLEASTWRAEWDRIRNGFGPLKRYYAPGPLLGMFAGVIPQWSDSERVFRDGISPLDHHENIPAIVSAYFGFDGPSKEESKHFVETPCIDLVCVLGKYTVSKRLPGFNKTANGGEDGLAYLWGEGDDALGGFLEAMLHAVNRFRVARELVAPSSRYYQPKKLQSQTPDGSSPAKPGTST